MHSFFTTCFDRLFPLSPDAQIVRDTSFETLLTYSRPRRVGDTLALASYRTPLVRACLHEAKFHHNERAIALLGEMLAEHLAKPFVEPFVELGRAALPSAMPRALHLVPIPLSAERLQERGYNQVIEIAHSARARVPHITIHDALLKKIRHTPSQTSLTRAERLENLDGVFAVGEHAIALDTPLLLFDDVTTTGSTLAEASRTLKAAGFTHIDQLALAH